MSPPVRLAKAELREIRWTRNQQVREVRSYTPLKVQFNPETLKVAFANQNAGGDQRGGSAVQFVGAGTTKLSMELWFDATLPLPDTNINHHGDVRRLTEKVAHFIKPKKKVGKKKWKPAGIRFLWGSFKFDGVMDSLEETLEYFSEDGIPLRARISINISSQMIQFQFGEQQSTGTEESRTPPGEQQVMTASEGDSAQQISGRNGDPGEWKSMARANNIERPHQISSGTVININLRG